MKTVLLTLLTLVLSNLAFALEPSNCLVWSLKADHQLVSYEQAGDRFVDILAAGKKFGFKEVSMNLSENISNFTFTYNREKVLSSTKKQKQYESLMTTLVYHINSTPHYELSCELEVPEPRPRISASN